VERCEVGAKAAQLKDRFEPTHSRTAADN
jgi:hypothetical protein